MDQRTTRICSDPDPSFKKSGSVRIQIWSNDPDLDRRNWTWIWIQIRHTHCKK